MWAVWLLLLVVALAMDVRQSKLQRDQNLKSNSVDPAAELVKLLTVDLKDPSSSIETIKYQIRDICLLDDRPLFCNMTRDTFRLCFDGIMRLMFCNTKSAEFFAKCFYGIDSRDAWLLVVCLVHRQLKDVAVDILNNSVDKDGMKDSAINEISKADFTKRYLPTKQYLLSDLVRSGEVVVCAKKIWLEEGRPKKQALNLMIANDTFPPKLTSFFYVRYSYVADSDPASFKFLSFSCPLIDESSLAMTMDLDGEVLLALYDLATGFFWERVDRIVAEIFYLPILETMVRAPGLIGWIIRVSEDIHGENSAIYNKNLRLSLLVESIPVDMKMNRYSTCKNSYRRQFDKIFCGQAQLSQKK